jgi:hypothetical protein
MESIFPSRWALTELLEMRLLSEMPGAASVKSPNWFTLPPPGSSTCPGC